MVKYKVGDRVRVKKGLVCFREYGNNVFVPAMQPFCGKVVTITRCDYSGYRVKELNYYRFTDEMIDCLVASRREKACRDYSAHKIVITTDGKDTIARAIVGKRTVEHAVAKCSPDDEFKFEYGAALAMDRLLARLSNDKTPEETEDVKEVNRRASVGEYIKITDPIFSLGRYERGDIFEVKLLDPTSSGVYVKNYGDGEYSFIIHDEYVVLENYEPKK